MAYLAYGSLEARSFTDLDLLVKQKDYFLVKSILKNYGYTPLKHLERASDEEEQFHLQAGEYTLLKEQGTIFADIHYRCMGGMNLAFSTDFSVFWDRLEVVEIAGKQIQTFSKTDTLIYLCLNGIKDGWSSLRHISDIATFVSNSPELNWREVNYFSEQLHLQTAVSLSLLLVESVTSISLPENAKVYFANKTRINEFSKILARNVIKNVETRASLSVLDELRMRFFLLETKEDRRKYISSLASRFFQLLFAVNSIDKAFVQLPNSLSILYYLVRPIRAFCQYRGSIVKILIK